MTIVQLQVYKSSWFSIPSYVTHRPQSRKQQNSDGRASQSHTQERITYSEQCENLQLREMETVQHLELADSLALMGRSHCASVSVCSSVPKKHSHTLHPTPDPFISTTRVCKQSKTEEFGSASFFLLKCMQTHSRTRRPQWSIRFGWLMVFGSPGVRAIGRSLDILLTCKENLQPDLSLITAVIRGLQQDLQGGVYEPILSKNMSTLEAVLYCMSLV